MHSQRSLTEGPLLSSLLRLALPIILANILQTAYQLTDAFWVGRLGGSAIAAVSASFPIVFLLTALGSGFFVAGSTLIAQYAGAGKRDEVRSVTAQTLLVTVIISLALGLLGYALTPMLLHWMGVADDVFVQAVGYMRVTFAGLLFMFVFAMVQSALRGVGQVKLPLLIVLGTVLLNLVLDPLFIFGWGWIPATGVMGAALATFGTQAIAAAIALVVLLRGRNDIHVRFRDFHLDGAFLRRIISLGIPASIEQSARALGLTAMTFLVASFGTVSLAAYGVGSNILHVVIIPAMGVSMAVSVLVGQSIGAGKIPRAVEVARIGALGSFGLLTTAGIIVFFAATPLVRFFVPGDPAVIAEGAAFVRIIALTYGFMGVQFAYMGVLRAAGQMVATMTLALVSQWVLLFPLALAFSLWMGLGVRGIWWAFPVTNILMAALSLLWYLKGDWKRTKLTEEQKFSEAVTEEILAEEGIPG